MRKDIAYVTLIYSHLSTKKREKDWKFTYKDLDNVIHSQALITIKTTPYIRQKREDHKSCFVYELTDVGRDVAQRTLRSISVDEIHEILYGKCM